MKHLNKQQRNDSKLWNIILAYPGITIVVILILCILPVIVIPEIANNMEKHGATEQTVLWIRTDLFNYIPTTLAFLGTIILSIVVAKQNADYSAREIKRQIPQLLGIWVSEGNNHADMVIDIYNTSTSCAIICLTGIFDDENKSNPDKNYLRGEFLNIYIPPEQCHRFILNND